VITLVLGGTRSGKSAVAESLALAHHEPDRPVLYVATGVATDDDMQARIERHRARRDERFRTVEAGADLVGALRAAPTDAPALIDALGTWVAAMPDLEVDTDALVGALVDRSAPTVVVSDEVGLGVHPSSEIGRRFRDVLGEVNQAVSAASETCLLVVAGRILPLASVADVLGAGTEPR
jgi:adenosyl cobinamide kinase/adenosyl cobinamide phosphate guanylyltransferase